MIRVVIFSIAIIYSSSIFSQFNLNEGDNCFTSGNYSCAVEHFEYVFKHTSGVTRDDAELKMLGAKYCAKLLKSADEAFNNLNYNSAKQQYTELLEYNPQDKYAQKQLEKCNSNVATPKLRKATTTELTDIWNNKYGQQPQRRQNLINAGIDPDDAQTRINNGEGKPKSESYTSSKPIDQKAKTLSASQSYIVLPYKGGQSDKIIVYSDAKTYSITRESIPSWCTTQLYDGYFTITAEPNKSMFPRKHWITIKADELQFNVSIEQASKPQKVNSYRNESSSEQTNSDDIGISIGSAPHSTNDAIQNCIFVGFKFEPISRSGIGINTGVNFEHYYTNRITRENSSNDSLYWGVNIPIHLEYRFSFKKTLHTFVYGGLGINTVFSRNFNEHVNPSTYEFGFGIRIRKVQFNIGKSKFQENIMITRNFGSYPKQYEKKYLSISFMF